MSAIAASPSVEFQSTPSTEWSGSQLGGHSNGSAASCCLCTMVTAERRLVVEVLELDGVLVRGVAGARLHVRERAFDVEVVAVGVPRQAALPAAVVIRVLRGIGEVLMLGADPGHHLRAGE